MTCFIIVRSERNVDLAFTLIRILYNLKKSQTLTGANLIMCYLIVTPLKFCFHISQVFYYQDVKCREEMYDKDIIMLQV